MKRKQKTFSKKLTSKDAFIRLQLIEQKLSDRPLTLNLTQDIWKEIDDIHEWIVQDQEILAYVDRVSEIIPQFKNTLLLVFFLKGCLGLIEMRNIEGRVSILYFLICEEAHLSKMERY